MDCPCGSTKSLINCCQVFHQDPFKIQQAEQLMRARFSAFATNNLDFVIDTYHSACNAHLQRDQIAQSLELNWVKLEIVNAEPSKKDTAFVEFKAWYFEENELQLLHERSRFLLEDISGKMCWRYIDGEFSEQKTNTTEKAQNKVGRNDSCPCKSGKKFKKCCG